MSDDLASQIAFECGQLEKLIEFYRPLLVKCADAEPKPIEIPALAVMLHSFYNGVENIFKRIALECNGDLPGGESWHRALLDLMSHSGPGRSAVISPSLAARLKKYLQFRHVFRSVYGFLLSWERMAPLVMECEATLRLLETELDAFLQSRKQDA